MDHAGVLLSEIHTEIPEDSIPSFASFDLRDEGDRCGLTAHKHDFMAERNQNSNWMSVLGTADEWMLRCGAVMHDAEWC